MWTYLVDSGWLLNPVGDHFAQGYSGAPGAVNDPTKQTIPDVGPIPEGMWSVGTPYDDANTGPYTLPLTPQEGTETFGRGEFKIHGDSIEFPGQQKASEGGIILARTVREAIAISVDFDLRVVAE